MLGVRKSIAAVVFPAKGHAHARNSNCSARASAARGAPMDQSLRRVPLSPHAYDPDSDAEDESDDARKENDEAPQEPITPAEPLTTVHHANIDEPSPRHPSVD